MVGSTGAAWQPMGNGPGVHHIGISPDGRRLYAVDRERTVFLVPYRAPAPDGERRGEPRNLAPGGATRARAGCTSASAARTAWSGSTPKPSKPADGSAPARALNLPTAAEDGSVVILPGGNGILTVARDDAELQRTNLPIGGKPSASTVSHDGRRAYVPDAARNLLVSVDLEQGSVLAETPVGDGPSHPIVTPDDRTVCIANSRSHDISLVDAQTFQSSATIPSGEAGARPRAGRRAGEDYWRVVGGNGGACPPSLTESRSPRSARRASR